MNANRKIRASLLAAGLAAFAAPSFADLIYEGPLLPEVRYSPAPARTYYYDPVTREYYYSTSYSSPIFEEPAIIVDAPRRSQDQLITDDVVDKLASDPRLSGKIGVQTYRNTVELTGRVTNSGQAEIAGRDAQSVEGVSEVRNELRTRVGGSR